ncbi:predicted protein, partial [Scheffersomyces stipitis CBS 6054]
MYFQTANIILGFLSIFATAYNHFSVDESPILRITSKNYDRHLISQALQKAYEDVFALTPNNHALLHLSSNSKINTERECIEKTVISYYLRDLKFITKEFEASECRVNTNNKYKSILQPTSNIHHLFHSSSDNIQIQLEASLMDEIQKSKTLGDIEFNQFDSLDYSLECLIGFQELAQVKMEETDIQTTLEKVIQIPAACGFQKIQSSFEGIHYETVKIDLPVNGTFY